MKRKSSRVLLDYLKHLGLVTVGLVIGLLAVEFVLAMIPEQIINVFIARHPIRYHIYRTDPDIGWRLKPNTQYKYLPEDNNYVQIQTNSNGLNDIESSYDKLPGVFRILILGDSFTESVQVPISDNFSRRLANCLNRYYRKPIEVINGGASYYGSAEELFFLQHVGVRYQPDLVLVAFYMGNDIDTYTARQTSDGWFDTFGGYLIELDEAGHLKKTWIDWKNPSPYEHISAIELFLRRHSHTYRLLTHSESRLADWLEDQKEKVKGFIFGEQLSSPDLLERDEPSQDAYKKDFDLMIFHPSFPEGPDMLPQIVEAWSIIKEVFVQIQAVSTSINAKLGVLIIPSREQAHRYYYNEAYKKYANIYGFTIANIAWNYSAPNQALTKFLTRENIPNLDLLPHFRAYDVTHSRHLYLEDDGHFNKNGHELTAELTCQWVQAQNFIVEAEYRREPD